MGYRGIGAFIVTLQLLMAAEQALAGQMDPLRCEAKHLRCESQLYDCLSRCDRFDARRHDDAVAADSSAPPRCDDACYGRYGAAMDRMRDKPPCAEDVEPPDPEQCEAKVLRADATAMLCLSHCARRAQHDAQFDTPACTDDCHSRHDERVAEILATPVCAAGRVAAAQ